MTSRRRLVTEIGDQLGHHRLVTLTGPGGIGKTWLARAVAGDIGRGFPAGATVVDVSEAGEAGLLPSTVARGLNVMSGSAELDVSGLTRVITTRHVLLVLDGCDKLLHACADLVTGLLRGCPNLAVLATSRQPLRVSGEQVLVVPPLSVPPPEQALDAVTVARHEAVEMFLERAAASSPEFRLTPHNVAAVVAVCGALEGNPLAIELAAARTRVLAPGAILDRLAEPYRLLAPGSAPGGPSSLESSVRASYDTCSEQERSLWARLSVFPATFDLDAVEAVCSGDGLAEGDLLDLVDSLIDKSVLARQHAEVSHVRYRLPETLRAFGEDRLPPEERHHWRRRHLEWCDALVRTGAEACIGVRQMRWFPRFLRELANLRAALRFATSEPTTAPYALRIAAGLEPFWLVAGRVGEGRQWLSRALRRCPGTPSERVRALSVAAWFAELQDDPGHAAELLVEARALQDQVGALGKAVVARADGAVAACRGEHDEADAAFRQVLEQAALTGDPAIESEAWFVLGFNLGLAGHDEEAEDAVRRCLRLAEEAEEPLLRSYALGWLGLTAVKRGDPNAAATRVREALRVHAEADEPFGRALLLEVLAWSATAGGNPGRAAALAGAAHQLWKGLGVTAVTVPPLAAGRSHRLAAIRKSLGVREFQVQWERGASMSVEEVTRDSVERSVPRQRRPDASTPLTERELEVATLVGRGMANREIASVLTISVRTAQGHVESILRKLGFSSRAQIAAWVAARSAHQPWLPDGT